MAKLSMDEAKEMATRLISIVERFDGLQMLSGVLEDTQTNTPTDSLVVHIVVDEYIDKLGDEMSAFLKSLPNEMYPKVMLYFGVMLGMRYSFDYGTPEFVRRLFNDSVSLGFGDGFGTDTS